MANTFSKIYLQFVFAVRNREHLIPKNHKEELHQYITGLVQHRNAKMLAIHCMPDHVHIFVGFRFHWQEGFGVFSYSHSQLGAVINYIHNQEAHHQKASFKQEYIELLNKFEIPFNEKYLFEFIE